MFKGLTGLLSAFNKTPVKSASSARERLQIIIASKDDGLDYLPKLKQEILELIKKYADIDDDDCDMKLEHSEAGGVKVLELNISLPGGAEISN